MGGNSGSAPSGQSAYRPQSGNQRMYMGGGSPSYGSGMQYPSYGRTQPSYSPERNQSLTDYKSHLAGQEGYNSEWQTDIDKLYKTDTPYQGWMRNQDSFSDWYGDQETAPTNYNDTMSMYKNNLMGQEGWNPEWQTDMDARYKTDTPYESWMKNQQSYGDWYGAQQALDEVTSGGTDGTPGFVDPDAPPPAQSLQGLYGSLDAGTKSSINSLLSRLLGGGSYGSQSAYGRPYMPQASYGMPYGGQGSYGSPYGAQMPYQQTYTQGYNPFYGGYR